MRANLIGIVLAALAVAPALAQEIHATIMGAVTDPAGAAVAGAAISATNLGTGVQVKAVSGPDGSYFLNRLPRGAYRLTVEFTGFQQYNREPITLNVGDKVNVAVALRLGATSESVTVSAELSGIESNESVLGQTIQNKTVSELPLNGRNFIMLLQFNAGVIFTTQRFGPGGWTMPNQWATGGTSGAAFTMHGGRPGSNAFFLDGASQGVEGGPSYVPPPEAIEDMKVATPTSDASYGLSGGGVVNLTMRSGTNQFHGGLNYFVRNNKLNANFIQTNRAAANQPELANQRSQYHNFGALVSGPIIRNKLFFSGNYDGFRLNQAYPVTITVPTLAQRAGDFTQTLSGAGQMIANYDPLTTRQQGAAFVRDPFAGNRTPASRMVPVSQNILKLFPAPNVVTDPVTQFFNYANNANIGRQRYDSEYVKVDYIWGDAHRTFVSQKIHKGHSYRSTNGMDNFSPLASGNNPAIRQNYAATIDHVATLNPTTVLNVRLGWDRYIDAGMQAGKENFDGGQLGFKGPVGSNPKIRIPILAFTDYTTVANTTSNYPTREPYTVMADLSKTVNRHLLRVGTRIGQARYNTINMGNWDGTYSFNRGFTQRDPQRGDTTSGHAIAAFLLGYPASGSTDVNTAVSWENKFAGLYVQDDFKVNRKLTLNFGLRWDLQTAPTERFNRTINGFDPRVSYALGAAQARGGLTFASEDRRQPWATKWRDLQPRFGAAYQLFSRMIWRGGYGISYLPLNSNAVAGGGVYPQGFSRSTPYVATIGGGVDSFIPGRPGTGTFENPFPTGILQPFGSALGPKTLLGQAISYVDPGYVVPRVHQFYAGVAYELPWKATLDVSYVGSRTRRMNVARAINVIPLEERLKGVENPTYLNTPVPNPFAGAPELAGTGLFAATTSRSQSLLPFPQFGGISMSGNNIGSASYNSLALKVNKRMSHGLTVTANYTFAKAIEALAYREAQTPDLLRQLSNWDRTHHLVVYTLYDLPFGKQKPIGGSWPRALDLIAGGWQANMSVEWMNGSPTAMPGAVPLIDPRLPDGQQSYQRWFNTCTVLNTGARVNCASPNEPAAWLQLRPNELRTYSSVFPNLRNHWLPQYNASIMKRFRVVERVTASLRVEAFNVFNTRIYPGPSTTLTSPDYGKVAPDQNNFPREMQIALQFRF